MSQKQSQEPKSTVLATASDLRLFLKRMKDDNLLSPYNRGILDRLISQVENAATELEFYDKHDLYKLLHNHLRFMHNSHPEVNSFIIKVNLQEQPTVPAYFEYNLFPSSKQLNELSEASK
ncbi:hypothetical protein [Draconibacterium halophilum]|uniref:Uncharacterized protein n=1 Tax=Draconibacterium halophilum TaxID=2706887 RepID=A0A6C0RFG0_9BACT|nr:hypothetical protein [Draconibacterium halophilum]QIA08263.1 hypothetical protein G0Q07_11295 [Draconibacterium halophilum]